MTEEIKDCFKEASTSRNENYGTEYEYARERNAKKRTLPFDSKFKLKRIALNDITNISHSPSKFISSDEEADKQRNTGRVAYIKSERAKNEETLKLLCLFSLRTQREGALPRSDYFEVVQKNKQGPFTREMVAKWIFRVVEELKLSYNTAFLALGYFDRFLSKVKLRIQFIPTLSRACLFVAAKFWECNPPSSKQLFSRRKSEFRDDLALLLKFEILLLQVLKWELAVPHAFDIFCACIDYLRCSNDVSLVTYAYSLLQKYATEYSMLRLSPSTLAIHSILVALHRNASASRFDKSLCEDIEKISTLLQVTPSHQNEFQNLLKAVKRRIFCNKDSEDSVTSPTSIINTANPNEH